MTREEFERQKRLLDEIQNVDEKINYACKLFSEGKIAAKVLRDLYLNCDKEQKLSMVNQIYSKENEARDENMRRCPPKQLIKEEQFVFVRSA